MSHTPASIAQPTHSGYAPAQGLQVYYEVHGQGMPIILLHGAYFTIEMNWSQLIPELSKTRQVIAIEMQGHGHTPLSDRELSRTHLAQDITSVMDHLGIETADVLGYSFGGTIAYQFAIQHPDRLRKLIIISAVHKTTGWLPVVTQAFQNLTPELFDTSPLKTAYDAIAPDKSQWTPFVKQMIASAQTPFDLGDHNIAAITAPTLLIAGDNDGMDKTQLIHTYELLGGIFAGHFAPPPKSQLAILPGQGHLTLLHQTQTILDYTNTFLA